LVTNCIFITISEEIKTSENPVITSEKQINHALTKEEFSPTLLV